MTVPVCPRHTSTGTLTKRDKDGIRTERRAKFRSLGKEFMKSINKLVEQIDSTHVHFIRTLKTNKPMTPGYFQPDYVIPQLQDQGLLALCDLLKAGFPSRIEYGELVERFSPKMPVRVAAAAHASCDHAVRRSPFSQTHLGGRGSFRLRSTHLAWITRATSTQSSGRTACRSPTTSAA